MSQLSKLYETMENLKELGFSISDDLIEKANKLEEDLIKEEVLPLLTKTIEPALKQVRRKLTLVVDYEPNRPLSVHLSRKRDFAHTLEDAKIILPDQAVEHTTNTIKDKSGSKQPATKLKLTFDNGTIIEESTASETFRRFVIEAGIINVRNLGITKCRIPLISNTLDAKYKNHQSPLGNGWYLMTNSNTMNKKRDIEFIAASLSIKVKVEVI